MAVAVPTRPSWSVAVAAMSVWPGAPAVIVARPLASSVSGWPLTVSVRLVIGATLPAMAWIMTCWPGIAGKLGVSTIVTLGGCGWTEARIRMFCVEVAWPSETCERDDVVAGLGRAGRPLELAGLRVERGAGGQVERRVA